MAASIRSLTTEVIDELTEAQRFTLAPMIGADLVALKTHRHDQRTFAFHARAIAEAVALVAGSDGPASEDPVGDLGAPRSWPQCLRGEIAEGFSLVLPEGLPAVTPLVVKSDGPRGAGSEENSEGGRWAS